MTFIVGTGVVLGDMPLEVFKGDPAGRTIDEMLAYDYAPDRLLVKFPAELASSALQAQVIADLGAEIRWTYQHTVPGLVGLENLSVTVPEALVHLLGVGGVEYAEPAYIVHLFESPNDSQYNNLWGMNNTGQSIGGQTGIAGADINAEEAWNTFTGDPNFLIAVIDEGVDHTHEDLSDNHWRNPGEIPGNGIDDDSNGFVDDVTGWDFYDNDNTTNDSANHGSHCSGTIGGVGNNGVGVAGVNWQCSIIACKFLEGSGSLDDGIAAINYSVMMGAKVSSNSWGGGGFSAGMEAAIESGQNIGQIFIAAAGNGGGNGASYPAAYTLPNIIAVAATDNRDQLASFSQYSSTQVDVGAPGVDVLSSVPGGYDYYSGTSMATPHTSGLTALVYAHLGGSDWAEVKNIIMSTTRPVSSLAGKTVTGGVIDAGAAIAEVFGKPTITLTSSIPGDVDPNTPIEVVVEIDPREDTLVDGSLQLLYRLSGGGFMEMDLDHDGGMTYSASVPGAECDELPEFYVRCEGDVGGEVTLPSGGSSNAWSVMVGEIVTSFEDDFQSNLGWSVENSASLTDGAWARGTPQGGGDRGDNASDFDGSGMCYCTDPGDGNTDVDGGTTTLVSPTLDASVSGAILSYAYWYSNDFGAIPTTTISTLKSLMTTGPVGSRFLMSVQQAVAAGTPSRC